MNFLIKRYWTKIFIKEKLKEYNFKLSYRLNSKLKKNVMFKSKQPVCSIQAWWWPLKWKLMWSINKKNNRSKNLMMIKILTINKIWVSESYPTIIIWSLYFSILVTLFLLLTAYFFASNWWSLSEPTSKLNRLSMKKNSFKSTSNTLRSLTKRKIHLRHIPTILLSSISIRNIKFLT